MQRQAMTSEGLEDQSVSDETRWTRLSALHGADTAGRDRAWSWFVERYSVFVRGALSGLLRRAELVAEAESEFWGYAYLSRAFPRADRNRRFRAYLSGMVHNFALSWARKRRLPGLAPDQVEQLVASDAQRLREADLWAENVIANALSLLRVESPKTALAITLFYGVGTEGQFGEAKSAAEVSATLGNTLQSVYLMLFRGRRRLRELILVELRAGCEGESSLEDELKLLLGSLGLRSHGLLGGAES
jgi:DNA-directed RNA polymerase specialized sigma24 family protein